MNGYPPPHTHPPTPPPHTYTHIPHTHAHTYISFNPPVTDLFSQIDPYVVLRFNGELVGRTRAFNNTPNPLWEEVSHTEGEEVMGKEGEACRQHPQPPVGGGEQHKRGEGGGQGDRGGRGGVSTTPSTACGRT